MEALQVDGNNILDVIRTVRHIKAEMAQSPRPFLLELMTFRMRGHEEASGTKYYPEGLQESWESRDPVVAYENYLLAEGILSEQFVNEIKADFKQQIQTAFDQANAEPKIVPNLAQELTDVYVPVSYTHLRAHET